MSDPCTTDEVLEKVEAISVRLDLTQERFDRAVARFNSVAPKIDKLLAKKCTTQGAPEAEPVLR